MNELKAYTELIDKKLYYFNPEFNNLQNKIYKSVNYSLSAGGKRLRPILLLEMCKIFGGDSECAMAFACAMEMIHTYSLVHDDLPAMDNDDLRRGKPTNHIVFGEATAILAGDALLTKAFEIMAEAPCRNKNNQLKAISYIASSAGTEGMIGGQIVDLDCEGKSTDIETVKYMHSLKTGALIKASCVVGGIIADADKKSLSIIENFAENLGIAFQIRDDILDVTGDEVSLGKPIGSDKESGKSTYVKLLGIDKSECLCSDYTNKALEALKQLEGDTEFLEEITKFLAIRKK